MKADYTGDYETDFPGIQPGDVLGDGSETSDGKWANGHVAIYMGNNIIYEYYTSDWDKQGTEHVLNGMYPMTTLLHHMTLI